ncbi:cytochrome c biogenesis CcdA family protein [Nocardioides korecus]
MNGLLALAFAAGMLAPVNPCGFALLPAWFTYTIGDTDDAPTPVRLARSLRGGVALTLGFAGTLSVVGIAVSAGAHAIIGAAPWIGLAIGVALVLLGVLMLAGRSFGIRLPASRRPARRGAPGTGRMVAFGAGYAAASLSCTFGVLLAVIAQAQATATFVGLLAVFAAYALGSAVILLLVAVGTAVAGAVLIRRIAMVARYGNRITAVVLLVTGAYLAWYWLPAATGDGSRSTGVTRLSTTAADWLQEHTAAVAWLSVTAVVTVVVVGVLHRYRSRGRNVANGTAIMETPGSDATAENCCTPEAGRDDPAGQASASSTSHR